MGSDVVYLSLAGLIGIIIVVVGCGKARKNDRTVTPSELRRQHVSKGQSHSKSSSSNSDDVKTADIRHKAPDLKQSASAKDPSARVTEGVFAPGPKSAIRTVYGGQTVNIDTITLSKLHPTLNVSLPENDNQYFAIPSDRMHQSPSNEITSSKRAAMLSSATRLFGARNRSSQQAPKRYVSQIAESKTKTSRSQMPRAQTLRSSIPKSLLTAISGGSTESTDLRTPTWMASAPMPKFDKGRPILAVKRRSFSGQEAF